MKKTKRILLTLLCIILAAAIVGAVSIFAAEEETVTTESKGEIQVWLIAGQSNAVGYGLEVPEDGRLDSRFTEGFDNVIAYGRLAATEQTEFAPVKVGMGKNDTSCGAEVGIASALGNSGENHAVIKYAVGGTKLHPFNNKTWTSPSYVEAVSNDEDTSNDIDSSWTQIGYYYETFMQTVTDGLALLVADGYTPVIKGLWWMQGEAETTTDADWAPEYEKLLTYLVDDMRRDLAEITGDASINSAENPMPFVIGKINRNPDLTEEAQAANVAVVNAAQEAVAAKRTNVSVVDAAKAYKYHQYDSWHYNTETQMYLGEQFVSEVLKYENKYLVYADGRYAGINTGLYTAGESVAVSFKTVEGYSIKALTMQVGDGEPVAVELTDGEYTIESMPEANVRFAVTAAAEDVVTDYGTIPGEYYDATDYPFVIFNANGEFVAADYTFTTGAVPKAAEAGDGAVILVRRDYDMSVNESNGKSNLSALNGSMTVDLGGYVISMGSTSSGFDGMIKCEAHVLGNVTNVTVKNGTILLGEDPIVRFSGADAEDRTSATYVEGYADNPQKFTVTLDGLTIGLDTRHSDNTCTFLMSYENLSGNHTSLSDNTLIVKDCNVDLTGISASANLFKTGNIIVKSELLGGSVKVDDASLIKWVDGTNTQLTCGLGSDGEYTTLTVTDATVSYPVDSFENSESASLGFEFVEAKTENEVNYKVYQLSEGIPTNYGFIPAEYSSTSDFPWAVFDKNGTCILATKLWANADYLEQSAAAAASNEGDGSVILLRADYSLSASTTIDGTAVKNGNVQSLMSRHEGTITIDLNGKTVTHNTTGVDAFIKGEANKLGVETNIIVKNGTFIMTNAKQMIRFSSASSETRTNAAYVEGYEDNPQTFNITLEDIYINVEDEATILAKGAILYAANSATATANANVVLRDCDINFGNQAIAATLFGAPSNYPANVTVVGGSITSIDASVLSMYSLNGGKFRVLENEDGNYLKLIVPKDTSVISTTFIDADYSAVNDLVFHKMYLDGENQVWELQSPTLETPYGFIDSKFYNATTYPWIVFNKDGKCINGTKLFTTTAAASACEAGDGAIIYLRRDTDFDTDKQSGGSQNISKIDGTINIDLGGHTVTMGKGGNADAFIRCEVYGLGYTTYINMTNGNIIAGLDPIVRFSAIETRWPNITDKDGNVTTYDNNTDSANVHNFYVTLDGLDISIDATASLQGSCVITYAAATSGKTIQLTNNNVIVKNCSIDLTNADATKFIFGCPQTLTSNAELIGGTVTYGNKLVDVSGMYGNGLRIGKEEGGNYTLFKFLKGATAPAENYETVSGGEVTYAKVGADDTYDMYRLRPVAFADAAYAPKMSITLANSFIMNVYIPTNYTQKFTFNGVTYENLSEYVGEIATLDDGNDYYLVTVALGSSEAASEISLVSTVTVEESTATASFTFSIPKYAQKLLNDDGATEVEKQLVKDVLAYIQSAYNYFAGHNTTEEIARVNALVNELLSVGGEYSGDPDLDGTYSHNTALVKDVTLVLDAKPTIRFYVTDLNVEFYDAEGNLLNTVKNETNGYVELDVYAYALSSEITYKLGEESGTYHISHYVKMTEDDTDAENYDNLVNLVYCFVKYTESAAAYRTSVIGAEN